MDRNEGTVQQDTVVVFVSKSGEETLVDEQTVSQSESQRKWSHTVMNHGEWSRIWGRLVMNSDGKWCTVISTTSRREGRSGNLGFLLRVLPLSDESSQLFDCTVVVCLEKRVDWTVWAVD